MRLRHSLVATATLAVLAICASPAAGYLHPKDGWSGDWRVGTRVKDEDGRKVKQVYGQIDFRLTYFREDDGGWGGGRNIVGIYEFSGGGELHGRLDEKWGDELCATYSDGTGKGRFCVILAPNDLTFEGWYKPCRNGLCFRQDFWGKRLRQHD